MEKKIEISDLRNCIRSVVSPKQETMIENISENDLLKLSPGADLGLDSLDIVELSLLIEREFGVSFSEEIVGKWVRQCNYATFADILKDCNK